VVILRRSRKTPLTALPRNLPFHAAQDLCGPLHQRIEVPLPWPATADVDDQRAITTGTGSLRINTIHSNEGSRSYPVKTNPTQALSWNDSSGTGNEMTYPLLLNPFHSKQEEAATNVNRHETRSTRSTPVCSNCRSDDIISQATAQWSNEAQDWVLANTFSQPSHCNSCNGPCEIVWLPLN
jgi:hypothetical protein